MERINFTRLPNGRQLSYAFPDSAVMDEVCRKVFNGRDYQMIKLLKPDLIVDIGANVGCASLLFAGTYPNATVLGLEPASEPYAYLCRNARQCPNIKTFNIGAYDDDMEADLYLGAACSVTNSIHPNFFTSGRHERVRLRRVSTLLTELGHDHISILKLDAEGVELEILRDLADMFPRIDAIMVEYHSESDRHIIDHMLEDHFTMYASSAEHPHRGTMTFVATRVLRCEPSFADLPIIPGESRQLAAV